MESNENDLLKSESKRLLQEKLLRFKSYRENSQKLLTSRERSWLKKRGKDHYIDFDDSVRNELRKYFVSMDQSGSGSIVLEELADPLIALGLAENREEIKTLFDTVDTDKSGKIEFDEFLAILKNKEGNSTMGEFFKEMTRGKLVEDSDVLPFNLVVSSYRRKMLMEAVVNENSSNKPQAEKIMRAYSKQLEKSKKKLSL